MFWNDENPSGKDPSDVAHQKGLLFFDGTSGMYLVHSVPKFPPQSGYAYPDTGMTYGQSFLCLTVGSADVNNIILSLTVTRPSIYYQNVDSSLQNKYRYLGGLLRGNYTSDPTATSTIIRTLQGTQFTLFAKNREWDAFLYEDLVAPTLGTDLICETWTLGALSNIVPSFCKNATIQYSVYDAMHISFEGNTWSRNQDHSKWVCISFIVSLFLLIL